MKLEIVPAVLEKTKSAFMQRFRQVEPFARKIQIDFEDGKFTKTKTITPAALKGLKTKVKLDFHLMIKNPEKTIQDYLKIKPYNITFQIEGSKDPLTLIKHIKSKKVRVGIAINPETPLEQVKHYLSKVNQVLIMTVHPGKQGQNIVPSTLKKVKALRKIKPKLLIQVDGGVKQTNIKTIKKAGANSFVVGSAIVKQKDIKKEIIKFNNIIK